MGFEVGDTIGDYEVVGVLGAGGMGQVYKVRNLISERVEAMKVLLPDLTGEPELADRFLREIKVQASLDHPNIAKLHTALRAANQLIMVMEMVEGTTLEHLLEPGPLPLDQALRYISDALGALDYAHGQGVIHRDIKPANIMLTPDGVIKLMDFGIAKAAGDRKMTMTGTTMGSLYYMSPEQVKGVTTLDPRSDIYSLGITLYEVVTGRRPFQGDSDYAIMSAHLEKMPVPPIEMDPTLPAALNEIILQAIAKDPGERFQSAGAFRVALESVRGAVPEATRVRPRPAPRVAPAAGPAARPGPEPLARPAGGHRGLYVLAGSVLTLVILLVAGIQVANWRKTKAQVPEEQAPVTPAEATAPAMLPTVSTPAPPGSQPPAAQAPPASPQPAPPARVATQPATPTQAPGSRVPAPEPTAPAAPATTSAAPAASPPVERSGTLPPAAPKTSAPAAAVPPPQNTAAAQELRERMVFLASRAVTVRSGLANIERQQARMGVGLRPDMAASNQRMDFLMKEAGGALAAGDLAAAKRHADLAEREVEKLEKFLGK